MAPEPELPPMEPVAPGSLGEGVGDPVEGVAGTPGEVPGGDCIGALAGGGDTCSAGAFADWSDSSEHAAKRPTERAAAANAKGVRRTFIVFSYSIRYRQNACCEVRAEFAVTNNP